MKRCPTCNRVETDDALVFCRADGTALVSDSSSLDSERETASFGLGPVATEVETSILPHKIGPGMGRSTGPTTALPAPSGPASAPAKPKRRRATIAAVIFVTAAVAAVSAVVVNS